MTVQESAWEQRQDNDNEMGTVWVSESTVKSINVSYLAPQGYNKVTS